MFIFKSFLSKATVVLVAVSSLVFVSPAHAEVYLSDVVYEAVNDDVVVADDVSLDTVSGGEYVVVSAPASLKGMVDNAPTSKEFFVSGTEIVSLMMKDAAVELAASNPEITVETNQMVSYDATSQLAPAWGLDRIDSPFLPLSDSYNYNESGLNVNVYIVDSGINTSHEEFAGRLGVGYSALDSTSSVEDCAGHGTHVSGIAAGEKYGVAKGATVIPVRVFDCNKSGNSLDVVEGLQWIVDNNSGPAVVNMSLGGGYSQALNNAIAAVVDLGIPVVVASGNETTNACIKSPASEPKAITVGASDRYDSVMSWSNYGSCVDVVAPGSTIRSAYIGGSTIAGNMSGTSMAAPAVTGAVARILEAYPNLTPAEVSAKLDEFSSKNVLTGSLNSTPNKLLNLPEYINPTLIPAAPDAPVVKLGRVLPILSKTKAYISGTHAASATPITSYTVTATLNGSVYKTQTFENPDTSLPLNLYVDGLQGPNIFTVNVTASNAAGESLPSSTLTVKAEYSRPSNVANLTKTLTASNVYNISWSQLSDVPANNGGLPLSGYRVAYSKTGKVWTTIGDVLPNVTSIETPVFAKNTIYYVKVTTFSDSWKNASTSRVISFKTLM